VKKNITIVAKAVVNERKFHRQKTNTQQAAAAV
jgi:hypothetical protein